MRDCWGNWYPYNHPDLWITDPVKLRRMKQRHRMAARQVDLSELEMKLEALRSHRFKMDSLEWSLSCLLDRLRWLNSEIIIAIDIIENADKKSRERLVAEKRSRLKAKLENLERLARHPRTPYHEAQTAALFATKVRALITSL